MKDSRAFSHINLMSKSKLSLDSAIMKMETPDNLAFTSKIILEIFSSMK